MEKCCRTCKFLIDGECKNEELVTVIYPYEDYIYNLFEDGVIHEYLQMSVEELAGVESCLRNRLNDGEEIFFSPPDEEFYCKYWR
jgi:hypothetical protein